MTARRISDLADLRAVLLNGKKITVKIEFHKPPGRLSDLIAIALDLLSILYRGQGCAHGPQWTAKV